MSTHMISAPKNSPPDGGIINEAAYADPPVVLDAAHVDTLLRFASAAMPRAPDVADRLLQEIERALVLPSEAALIGLAQGSSIRWQARDGETREMTIVQVNA